VRWHIDWLVETPTAEALGAVVVTQAENSDWNECALNKRVGAALAAACPVPGFGASDCSDRCPAHLWYVEHPLSLLQLAGISPAATVVLPAGRHATDDPSPDWPEGMPRFVRVDAPHHD
jgi:Uri superfamily endonuclease